MVQFLNMTSAEYREFIKNNMPVKGITKLEQKAVNKSKYKAEKETIDGRTFDSKKEAKRYRELKTMVNAGLIKDLTCQKPFELLEAFTDNTGKKQRPIIYICDFFYYDVENKWWVVEDVKSTVTRTLEVYRMKKKIFLYKYPQYHFNELV